MTELPVLSLASLGVDSLPLSGESDPNLPTIRNFDPPKHENNQNVNNSPQHDVDEYIAPGTSASIYPSRTIAMPLTSFSSMDSNLPPSPPSSSRTLNIESQHTYNNNNEYRTTYAPIQADMHIQSASPSTFAHKAVDSHRELTQSQSESPLLHSNRTSTSHHASSLYPKHNIHIDNKKQFYKAHIFRRPNIPVSLPPRRYYDYRDGSNNSHPPSYDSKPNSSEGQCTCFAVTYTCSQCKQSIARTSLNNNNSLPVNPPQSSSPAHSPSPSTTPSTPNDAPCCCDSKSPPTYPAVISLPELEAEVQSRYGLSEEAESAALEANQRALEKFALHSAEAAALPRLRTCSGQLIYTWSEVRRHASAESCWLVVRGVVYDVTPMLATHPAGIQSILRHAGTDASQHYDFHSPKAHQLWKKYEIGVIKGYKKPLCSIQ